MATTIDGSNLMLEFLSKLHKESSNLMECEENVKEAMNLLAPSLRISKATLAMHAPANDLRPSGDVHFVELCNDGDSDDSLVFTIRNMIPDGGQVEYNVWPKGNEGFSEEEKTVQSIIYNEVRLTFSSKTMDGILYRALTSDLATDISNHNTYMKYAGQLIAQRRIADYTALFFNIHNFKYVNRIFSFIEGSKILRTYAQLINSYLEKDEMLARVGGDNFTVLVRNENVDAFIKKISSVTITHSDGQREKTFRFGATVGAARLEDTDNPGVLMLRISTAFTVARKQGGGSVVYYSAEGLMDIMEEQSVLSNFPMALEKEEFVVYYQPKVNITDQTLCGAEALVRWFKKGEMVPPMKFIPILEREGSVCKLDFFVLETVCKMLKERSDAGLKNVCVSVNFSRRHLEEEKLVEKIIAVIDKYGVDHSLIEIEVTESENFQNYGVMSNMVEGLRAHGINTSIDDFGTGYSSLNMIKNVDLNVIKIDKSFIPLESYYPGKEKDLIMFRNIVGMVAQLGKKTIAEGVETKAQLEYLKEVGINMVQGYLFSKPLPKEDFLKYLEEGYTFSID